MSLLPEVRNELVATAARRAAAAGPGRRPRRMGGGTLAVALGVACTVAVVVVAVVAFRHRELAPAGSDRPAEPALAALEARLAILRRPQSRADRTYARYVGSRGPVSPLGVVGELARIAVTLDAAGERVRVYLLVRQLSRQPFAGAVALRSGFAIAVAVDEHGGLEGQTGPVTAATLKPDAVSESGVVVRGIGIERNRGVTVGIVPDGVARVRWTFTGADFGVLRPHPITVYPEVHGNVAVAPVRPNEGPLAGAVWYGAGGRVIASSGLGASARQELAQIHAVNASRSLPIAPELIAHYSLFRTVAPEDLTRDPQLGTIGSGNDLNYWETRYIPWVTGLDGRGLWITPGARGLCMMDWNAGGCGALKSTGFIGASTSDGRETTFTGLVPDGNRTVTLVLANGARAVEPVVDNVYEATVHGQVVAIINRDIHGRIVRTSLQ